MYCVYTCTHDRSLGSAKSSTELRLPNDGPQEKNHCSISPTPTQKRKINMFHVSISKLKFMFHVSTSKLKNMSLVKIIANFDFGD